MADWTNAYNRNGASCPSVMVCGSANFPARKKERQNARESALWEEYNAIKGVLRKIEQVGTGPVDLADPHAGEILADQLQKLTSRLERDKALNSYLGFRWSPRNQAWQRQLTKNAEYDAQKILNLEV